MIRILRRVALLLVCAAMPAAAQTCATGWAHVTATLIQSIGRNSGSTPALLSSGTFIIIAEDANGQPVNVNVPGGGIAMQRPKVVPIVSGGLTQTLCVPRSDTATPNVGYEIFVRDTSAFAGNAEVVHFRGVPITLDEWSFDAYHPVGPAFTAASTSTHSSGPPLGTCSGSSEYLDDTALVLYRCVSGVWEPLTGSSGGSGITQLTGAVTAFGPGQVAATITPTGVSAGAYNLGGQVVAVNAAGQITAIGNPFGMGMSSCSACGTYEAGNATTSPATFTFSYSSGTPASATLSDGTSSIGLTSPFTSASIARSYCTQAQGFTSFTFSASATATNGQTATTGGGISCTYQTFAGLGTGGTATGATANAATTAALAGASGTLPSIGWAAETGTYTFSPNGQYIYFVLGGSGHTFKVNGFGTTFGSNTFTLTNFHGVARTMTVYSSPTYYTANAMTVEVD